MQITKKNSKYVEYDTDCDEKLVTFHIYPNTHLITIQSSEYTWWAENEFEYLRNIVNIADGTRLKTPDEILPPSQNILFDESLTLTEDNASDAEDDSITFVKRVCSTPAQMTPRIVSPIDSGPRIHPQIPALQLSI